MSDDVAPTRQGAVESPSHGCAAESVRKSYEMTRRSFLGSMSAAGCLSVGTALLPYPALGANNSSAIRMWQPWLHAAVRSDRQLGSIHTLALTQRTLAPIDVTPCPGITALALHPSLPMLYASTDVLPGQALPHGHVEVFFVEEKAGVLRSVARVPMSLSATGPRSLAVSPDGSSLLVAASTGGLWNAFELDAAGLPCAVPVARKEIGTSGAEAGQSVAHPHSVLYVPGERLAFGSDNGSNQISILSAEHDRIRVHARYRCETSLRPSHMALTADNNHLLVANVDMPSLSLWRLHRSGDTAHLQQIAERALETPISAVRTHPVAPLVYSVRPDGVGSLLQSWRMDGRTQLRLQTIAELPYSSATSLIVSRDALMAATAQGLLRLTMEHNRLTETSLLYPLQGLIGLAG